MKRIAILIFLMATCAEAQVVRMATEDWVTNSVTKATNALAKVAHTGEYSDLKNLPPLPPTPQAMTNIAETVTGVATGKLATVAHTGDYDDLLNKPLSFSETDPVAIPRILSLEAETNKYLQAEADPVAIPRIEALESQTNSYLVAELDLRALRLYHYGSTDIVESPDDWFTWTVSGGKATVTGLNWDADPWDPPDDPAKRNIVIPWEYDGVPVEAIGGYAFEEYLLDSLRAPKTLVSVGSYAFATAYIGSLSLPAATSIGSYAFMDAIIPSLSLPALVVAGDSAFAFLVTSSFHLPALTSAGVAVFEGAYIPSLHLPAATSIGSYAFEGAYISSITFSRMPTTIGVDIFDWVSPLPTITITDPTDPNTDASLQGAPIVRPTINPAGLPDEEETLDPWIDWSATITPVNGTATVTRATGADPVLVLTDDVVLSVPTTGWPTTGVARVSLSLWAGTHSVTLLTNTVEYSSTPTISTNDWTTILFRRTGNQSKWKGVGL